MSEIERAEQINTFLSAVSYICKNDGNLMKVNSLTDFIREVIFADEFYESARGAFTGDVRKTRSELAAVWKEMIEAKAFDGSSPFCKIDSHFIRFPGDLFPISTWKGSRTYKSFPRSGKYDELARGSSSNNNNGQSSLASNVQQNIETAQSAANNFLNAMTDNELLDGSTDEEEQPLPEDPDNVSRNEMMMNRQDTSRNTQNNSSISTNNLLSQNIPNVLSSTGPIVENNPIDSAIFSNITTGNVSRNDNNGNNPNGGSSQHMFNSNDPSRNRVRSEPNLPQRKMSRNTYEHPAQYTNSNQQGSSSGSTANNNAPATTMGDAFWERMERMTIRCNEESLQPVKADIIRVNDAVNNLNHDLRIVKDTANATATRTNNIENNILPDMANRIVALERDNGIAELSILEAETAVALRRIDREEYKEAVENNFNEGRFRLDLIREIFFQITGHDITIFNDDIGRRLGVQIYIVKKWSRRENTKVSCIAILKINENQRKNRILDLLNRREQFKGDFGIRAVAPRGHDYDEILHKWINNGIIDNYNYTKTGYLIVIINEEQGIRLYPASPKKLINLKPSFITKEWLTRLVDHNTYIIYKRRIHKLPNQVAENNIRNRDLARARYANRNDGRNTRNQNQNAGISGIATFQTVNNNAGYFNPNSNQNHLTDNNRPSTSTSRTPPAFNFGSNDNNRNRGSSSSFGHNNRNQFSNPRDGGNYDFSFLHTNNSNGNNSNNRGEQNSNSLNGGSFSNQTSNTRENDSNSNRQSTSNQMPNNRENSSNFRANQHTGNSNLNTIQEEETDNQRNITPPPYNPFAVTNENRAPPPYNQSRTRNRANEYIFASTDIRFRDGEDDANHVRNRNTAELRRNPENDRWPRNSLSRSKNSRNNNNNFGNENNRMNDDRNGNGDGRDGNPGWGGNNAQNGNVGRGQW